MSLWQPVSPDIWQGRDDRHEASNALRLFQTVRQSDTQQPSGNGIALIGFACDEGVRRNQGRTGAAQTWAIFALKGRRWRPPSRR